MSRFLIFLAVLLVAATAFAAAPPPPPPPPPPPVCPNTYVWGPLTSVQTLYEPPTNQWPTAAATLTFKVEYSVIVPDWGRAFLFINGPDLYPRGTGSSGDPPTLLECGCCYSQSEIRRREYGVNSLEEVQGIMAVMNDPTYLNIGYYELWDGIMMLYGAEHVNFPDPGPFPE